MLCKTALENTDYIFFCMNTSGAHREELPGILGRGRPGAEDPRGATARTERGRELGGGAPRPFRPQRPGPQRSRDGLPGPGFSPSNECGAGVADPGASVHADSDLDRSVS